MGRVCDGWRGDRLKDPGLSLGMILDRIEDRIVHPVIDGGFSPPGAARRDLQLTGERACLNLAVKCRSAEAGASEDSRQTKDTIGMVGHFSYSFLMLPE